MKIIHGFVFTLLALAAQSQELADFENFAIDTGVFLNGSDGGGGFTSGPIFLPNDYSADFDSWTGWAISSMRDTVTPGFFNQYSAITGGGADGSDTYAVSFATGANIISLVDDLQGEVVDGLYITNGTYGFLSMRDGDSFAKKFGGASGMDPDFFRLTIKAYHDGELSEDSVDFYLADFRFSESDMDYIVDGWQYVDLSDLGPVDSLQFALASSDVGQFGINTPTYFCVDNIETGGVATSVAKAALVTQELHVFPNPASDYVELQLPAGRSVRRVDIHTIDGALIQRGALGADTQRLEVHSLTPGTYILATVDGREIITGRFIKQ